MVNNPSNSVWDKIAKVGVYRDMTGAAYEFTPETLQSIADSYAKSPEKAPLVFGHPKTDSPAQGWVTSLRVNGDYLEAQYELISQNAKSGAYRYKSISLEPNTNKLRHVGLLGAVPPAISGLGEFSFSKDDKGVITVNFAEETAPQGDKKPMDEKALALLSELQAKIAEKEKEVTDLKGQVEELAAKVKEAEGKEGEAEKKATETEGNFAKFRAETANAARTARIDALVAQGKVAPAEKEKHLSMLAALAANTAANFALSDGKSITAEEQYLRDLEAREVSAMFSSFSAPEGADKSGNLAATMVKGL